MSALTVIPLRPFENALRQARLLPLSVDRRSCIRRVLGEIQAGRSGNATAAELQRQRLQRCPTPDGAA
ncbi:hypothetical protein [Lysobacter enzymogenes]|uniref:hypothetical protein n=1 Tax=Lysobacter enzymogenes TaxID=69 RepID=UPI00099C4C4E|nr:hypothetical protein [Lysobacter enzymogenes]UZW62734.1 hypothetical protein BV903_010765 [Lysobacter enzymogenes]